MKRDSKGLYDLQHCIRRIENATSTSSSSLGDIATHLANYIVDNEPEDSSKAEDQWVMDELRRALADVENSIQLMDDVCGRLRWAYSRARAVALTWEDD